MKKPDMPKNCNWKDVVQYVTAVVALTSGIALAFLQYFDLGDITNGVLGYVAQTLVYAASIFGVTMYWNGKYRESREMWNRKYDELKNMVEHGDNYGVVDAQRKQAA